MNLDPYRDQYPGPTLPGCMIRLVASAAGLIFLWALVPICRLIKWLLTR
jgi:hypothetical protein